ncbi:MAG: PDZ domain-containing protein [Gemmatimonadota bacterium]
MEQLEERARREAEGSLRTWELQGGDPAVVWRFDEDGPGRRFRVFTDSLGGGATGFFGSDLCFRIRGDGGPGLALLGGGNCVDGVELVEMNQELGAYFETSRGVLVTDVADEATLGLRPGDVLLGIDGRAVEDPGHARRILESYTADEEIRLRVMRQGREIEVLGRRSAG